MADLSAMVGCILTNIEVVGDEEIFFYADLDSRKWKMYHSQNCCECVVIEDICGDLQDLIGSELLVAEERTSSDNPDFTKEESNNYDSSNTWTFYELRTVKGSVTIRWHGSSNGYYSEAVDFAELTYN